MNHTKYDHHNILMMIISDYHYDDHYDHHNDDHNDHHNDSHCL